MPAEPLRQTRVVGAAPPAANDAPPPAAAPDQRLAQLIRIEGELRACTEVGELWQHLVNEALALLPYGQSLVVQRADDKAGWRVVAVSGLSSVNRDSPMLRWYEGIAGRLVASGPAALRFALPLHADPEDPCTQEASQRELMWLPLAEPGRPLRAGWILARKDAWDEGHEALAQRLAMAYAHGASAIRGRDKPARPWRKWLQRAAIGTAVAVALLAFIPVPLTTMAPMEVAPQLPFVVAAPFQAVVDRILVPPGARVKAGDKLVQLVDTTLHSDFDVATQKLEVARARMLRVQQASTEDDSARRELAIAQSEEAVAAAELDFARAMLGKSVIRAEQAGVALYNDPRDWEGRPVAVGEAIMRVADPAKAEFRLHVPAADAVNLRVGAEATVFLDAAPLQPLHATLVRAAYKAEVDAAGVASFLVTARIDDKEPSAARLGSRGVARIHGEPVSLFFYLLRRPITAVRQWTGL
ncbi:efflux RND transporter periplasmic adaptor subunit [Pelomonas sp. KK5]|uniref:efflux RND transporter periplasmic adaptor subunit n=1 Tax=Pelomonas sp. KK5 TaxID=1855730 RepID=UPI00097C1244|nr:HlyD family efflux transporter periplasmic adaptor subunit [Pelomonas sp. KK5]